MTQRQPLIVQLPRKGTSRGAPRSNCESKNAQNIKKARALGLSVAGFQEFPFAAIMAFKSNYEEQNTWFEGERPNCLSARILYAKELPSSGRPKHNEQP